MEKLIKNALGQWQIIKEELYKAPVDPKVPTTPPVQPADTTPEVTAPALTPATLSPRDQNSQHLTGLFNQMKEHHVGEDLANALALKGQIKDHILNAPKGSIDFGVLGDLREKQHKGSPLGDIGRFSQCAINHQDMAEMINHHLGDARSIKDIHDNHGGMKAVETLMRTMGANGDPSEYSHLKFKKPGLHEDLLDLVNPGKAINDRHERRHEGVLPRTYLDHVSSNPKLDKKVEDTHEDLWSDDNQNWDNYSIMKAHEDAVVARGLDKFKRHFKL